MATDNATACLQYILFYLFILWKHKKCVRWTSCSSIEMWEMLLRKIKNTKSYLAVCIGGNVVLKLSIHRLLLHHTSGFDKVQLVSMEPQQQPCYPCCPFQMQCSQCTQLMNMSRKKRILISYLDEHGFPIIYRKPPGSLAFQICHQLQQPGSYHWWSKAANLSPQG